MQQVGTCTSTYFNELHRSLDECLVQALVYKNALGIFKEEREPEKEKRRLNWTHLIFISCLSFFLSLSLFDVSFFPLPLSLFSTSNLSFFCTYLGRLVGRSIPQLLSDNFILFSICIFHLFFFFEVRQNRKRALQNLTRYGILIVLVALSSFLTLIVLAPTFTHVRPQ